MSILQLVKQKWNWPSSWMPQRARLERESPLYGLPPAPWPPAPIATEPTPWPALPAPPTPPTSPTPAAELSLSLSLKRKVNLGNYESADVSVTVCGITPNTTQAEIDALLEGAGAVGFNSVRKALAAQVSVARSNRAG